jgi:ubiquinone/menaquinone biosynthesis C-methylase UbiE
MREDVRYIPALNRRWLTPAYDWVLKNLFREKELKDQLIKEAGLAAGQRVLDVGCGTGTLTVAIANSARLGAVVGLDGDADVLGRARGKAAAAGVEIQFDQGLSFALPYEDQSFDHVFASLMLHHLAKEDKAQTFSEVRRVLKPRGRLHIADFGRAEVLYAALVSTTLTIRLERTKENLRGQIPGMSRQPGSRRSRKALDSGPC